MPNSQQKNTNVQAIARLLPNHCYTESYGTSYARYPIMQKPKTGEAHDFS